MDPNLHGTERDVGEADDVEDSLLIQTYGGRGVAGGDLGPFVQNLTGFLREAAGETLRRSRMAHRVRQEQQAHDLHAYLAALSPSKAAEGRSGTGETEDEATSE